MEFAIGGAFLCWAAVSVLRRDEGIPPYGAKRIRTVFSEPDARNSIHSCRVEFLDSRKTMYRKEKQHPCPLNLWGQRCVRSNRDSVVPAAARRRRGEGTPPYGYVRLSQTIIMISFRDWPCRGWAVWRCSSCRRRRATRPRPAAEGRTARCPSPDRLRRRARPPRPRS